MLRATALSLLAGGGLAASFLDQDAAQGRISGFVVFPPPREDPTDTVEEFIVSWGEEGSDVKGPEVARLVWDQMAQDRLRGRESCGMMGAATRRLKPSTVDPKIVNGHDAEYCQYKWQVSLRDDNFHFCGGTLISSTHVMTAAHCYWGEGQGSSITVVLGDKSIANPDDQYQATRRVVKATLHPLYDEYTMTHDFMLLELDSEVASDNCIGTACIPNELISSGQCDVSGWGTLSSGGDSPDLLQAGFVDAITRWDCMNISGYSYDLDPWMICAQGNSASGIVDTCQGDSGGPLACPHPDVNGAYFLQGVTSFGYGCADKNYPGVYAATAMVTGWMFEEIGVLPDGGVAIPIMATDFMDKFSHFLVHARSASGERLVERVPIQDLSFERPSPTPQPAPQKCLSVPKETMERLGGIPCNSMW